MEELKPDYEAFRDAQGKRVDGRSKFFAVRTKKGSMSIQNDEKVAIKTYLHHRGAADRAGQDGVPSRDIREQKAQVDANRANLFELMKATGIERMPFDGGYARIKVNNSMRAVTKDVVSDALQP